ncbi:hypothetical protein ACVW0K_000520 [Streptomyces filamentosus]
MGRTLTRLRLAAAGAAVLTASVLLAPTAPAAAAPTAPAAWNCNDGSFCVYSGTNGTGSVCAWSGDDPDWNNGTSRCSWSPRTRVRSAYNHGLSGAAVSAYTAVDLGGTKVFCLRQGGKTNLPGSGTFLRSHTWSC